MSNAKLFFIDDHTYMTDGLMTGIKLNGNNIDIIGSATSCKDAFITFRDNPPSIVLLDILMPEMNGIDCCRYIKREYPDIKVIIVTGSTDDELLLDAWLANADGILSKGSSINEILEAIDLVKKDFRFISSYFKCFFTSKKEEKAEKVTLTKRELSVLYLLAQGHNRTQVAEQLNRSKEAVDYHCTHIIRKFGGGSMQQIISQARNEGIV